MKTCHKILFAFLLLGVVAGVAIEAHAYTRVKRIKQGIFLYSNWDAPYLTVDTCLDMSVTEAIVPDVVTWYGRDYGIAEIGPNAFRGCRNLVKLNIGTASRILKGALLDCPNLRVIISNNKIPPLLEGQHPFYGSKWEEVIEPYHTLTTTIVAPSSREQIALHLTMMAKMMMIDGKASDSEIKRIKSIAEKWGVDPSGVDDFIKDIENDNDFQSLRTKLTEIAKEYDLKAIDA